MRLDEIREGLFVAGTDTGVGKTVVAACVARALVRRGRRVGVLKPVASGGVRREGVVVSEDALLLGAASGTDRSPEEIAPFCFEAPLAPPLAARLEGREVRWDGVAAALAAARRGCDVLVVEGAGGLFSPLAEKRSNLDLARLTGLPLWLVVPARLGMIHQAVAALRAARAEGVVAAGFVANGLSEAHPHVAWDVAQIEAATGVPCVGRLPRAASLAAQAPGTDPAAYFA